MTENSPFTRRKFTLTEEDERELEELADRHYDGNVSLCIRAAVSEHQANLEGDGQRALQRLVHEMHTVSDQSAQLTEDLSSLLDQTSQIAAEQNTTLPLEVESTEIRDAESVYRLFREKKTGLTIEDVIEQSGIPPRRILPAVEFLVDFAYIRRTNAGRYTLLATTQTNDD